MTKLINIALQGGGAHGAFIWGVLDKILEDGRIQIEGISATSAGSMNGVVYSYGLHKGGPKGAREALHHFWRRISELGKIYSPVHLFPWEHIKDSWNVDQSLGYLFFDNVTSIFSPYEFNPLNINPLRDILEEIIDFEDLRQSSAVKLFLSATNVRTGKVRIFSLTELTIEAVLASACLPYLFQTVECDGEFYWDGGYMGNPAIFPLFYNTTSRDILIIHTNPLERDEIPKTARGIHNRVIEITFNSSLLKELRAIMFVQKLLHQDWLKEEYRDHFKDILLHSIRSDKAMCELSVPSKYNTDWDFLRFLFLKGRSRAHEWLQNNFHHLGKSSTVDIAQEFFPNEPR